MLQKTEKSQINSEPIKTFKQTESLYKLSREITVVRMTDASCIQPRRPRRPMLKRQNAVEIPEQRKSQIETLNYENSIKETQDSKENFIL